MATLSVGGTTVFDGSALQSGVTGSPVLTLPSTTTFPAGHILQVATSRNGYGHDLSSTSFQPMLSAAGTTWEPEIITSLSSSKVLGIFSILMKGDSSGQSDARVFLQGDWKIGAGSYNTFDDMNEVFGNYDRGGSGIWSRSTIVWTRLFVPGSADTIKFRFNIKSASGATAYHGPVSDGCYSNVTLMELVG